MWPPSGKKGLSCSPHLVLRGHSTDNNIIAHRGKKITRFHWVFVWTRLGLRDYIDVWVYC